MSKAALSQTLPTAMAFYHGDGFVPCFNYAKRFAGDNGRIVTLPDLIEARINSENDTEAWCQYFTTMSAEYFGYSKGGNRILIIAHGVGPMSDMEGIVQAYSFQFKDKTRDKRGGRITKEQFADLESGKYGSVNIVDFDPYYRRYQYPLNQQLRAVQAHNDPVVKARLGPRADEYLNRHEKFAMEYHRSEGHSPIPFDPYIISMEEDSNCWYAHNKDFGKPFSAIESSPHLDKYGLPIAHLLSIGQICLVRGGNEHNFPIFHTEVSCHGWHDGTRLLAVRDKESIKVIHPGPDAHSVLRKNWKQLMLPNQGVASQVGFYALMKVGNQSFTMYPKIGESMDSHEPEFMVTKNQIATYGPKEFRTKGHGSPFFKYGIKEVERIAPKGVNAYSLAEPVVDGNDHVCPIKFHKVEIDQTKRVMRAEDLLADYDLLMSFV
jgi:hypothetical protein